MSLLAWLVVGLIAGWLAGLVAKGSGYGLLGDVIIGIVGALLGGFLSGRLFGMDYVTGLNITTIVVAFVGALILIFFLRLLRGGRVA
jgi:uncharacterized membrane protein YeaQ/YmgE (transglycosylase-associated protein family)